MPIASCDIIKKRMKEPSEEMWTIHFWIPQVDIWFAASFRKCRIIFHSCTIWIFTFHCRSLKIRTTCQFQEMVTFWIHEPRLRQMIFKVPNFKMPHVVWHRSVLMSGRAQESGTAKKLQLYTSSWSITLLNWMISVWIHPDESIHIFVLLTVNSRLKCIGLCVMCPLVKCKMTY